MNEWVVGAVFLVVLFVLMVFIVLFAIKSVRVGYENKIGSLQANLDKTMQRLDDEAEQNRLLMAKNLNLEKNNVALESDCENMKKYWNEKEREFQNNEEKLVLKFKEVSSEIIKNQVNTFDLSQKKSLDLILEPFKTQITEFKSKVEVAHKDAIVNKSSLDEQLKNLFMLNENLSKDAQNLTEALKGSKKAQGDWGEFQLARVFEISGLEEGINFELQMNLKDEENKNQRPDAVVFLPNNRTVIIDSKVSLNDYWTFVKSDEEAIKEKSLNNHIKCIKNHIDGISSKEYQKLLKDKTLDYIVVFIPVESAYIDAVKKDTSLYDYAYKRNVMIATPSSLLPILRTIENLWRIEKQNKYVEKMAQVAGSLYDKIVNFVGDMQKIDGALSGARKNYDEAIKKLSTGKGNALSLAAKLTEYGAKSAKTMNVEFDNNDDVGALLAKEDNKE